MRLCFGSIVVVAVATLHIVSSQQCLLPVRADLEGSGGLLATALGATSTTLLSEPRVVCLASATTRDQYRSASVLVTFSRDDRTDVEFGQLDLGCTGAQQWSSDNIDLSPAANSSTSLRRDCAVCVASSNDPDYDAESHCLPCFGCTSAGLGQCTSPTPIASACCNFYDASDMCTLACPEGTGASADTNFTCIDPCSPNPCGNRGNCSPAPGGTTPTCSCVGSWEGDRCEVCAIADCQTCSQTVDVCSVCVEGFDMLAGICTCSLLCENGGVRRESQCSCSCPDGYSGPTCAVQEAGSGSQSCLVEDCLSCSSSSPMVCEECLEGFQLDDDQLSCSVEENFVGQLSLGAFIGVVVGCAVGVLALLTVIVSACCCCYCSRNRESVYV